MEFKCEHNLEGIVQFDICIHYSAITEICNKIDKICPVISKNIMISTVKKYEDVLSNKDIELLIELTPEEIQMIIDWYLCKGDGGYPINSGEYTVVKKLAEKINDEEALKAIEEIELEK